MRGWLNDDEPLETEGTVRWMRWTIELEFDLGDENDRVLLDDIEKAEGGVWLDMDIALAELVESEVRPTPPPPVRDLYGPAYSSTMRPCRNGCGVFTTTLGWNRHRCSAGDSDKSVKRT